MRFFSVDRNYPFEGRGTVRGSELLCVNSPLETKCDGAIGYADEHCLVEFVI